MRFLEADLEDIIWHNMQSPDGVKGLIDRGLEDLYYTKNTYRQLRIGNYGIADIVYGHRFQSKMYVTVMELKRNVINCDALIQSIRYANGLKSYLSKRFQCFITVNVVLIGNEVDRNSDWVYLLERMDNVYIYTYKYQIDGLYFEWESKKYALIEEGFNV